MGRAFTIALILALAIVSVWWQLAEKRARELDRDRARAVAAADSIAKARVLSRGDSIRAVVEAAARASKPIDSPRELARLRRLGVADPARSIREALARHRDLIPFPGVRGGTMFFDTSTVVVLPGGYVYAGFEDGHVAGHGVFEVTVAGGNVRLKQVTAKLD